MIKVLMDDNVNHATKQNVSMLSVQGIYKQVAKHVEIEEKLCRQICAFECVDCTAIILKTDLMTKKKKIIIPHISTQSTDMLVKKKINIHLCFSLKQKLFPKQYLTAL